MARKPLTGTFLEPGASKNRRKYTTENIGRAVERMKTRLKSGQSIPMHTSHLKNQEGDTLATAAMVTKVWQENDGRGRFEYEPLNTAAGDEITKLRQAKALNTVSIFGSWVGEPRMEDGFETADDLDVMAIDFTHRPGVSGAKLDESEIAAELAATGSTIWESFDEAFVDETVTEDEPEASLLAMMEAQRAHTFENGYCRTCEADGTFTIDEAAKKPYGDVTYADTGYQADGKARYPIDTKAHVRAAWSYVNQAKNQKGYTSAQVRSIKSKIKRAASKFGIDIAGESAELEKAIESLGAEFADILEAYASANLDNGQGYISVSAYTDDPANLPKVGQAVARAALAGLLKLDPDNDGDVDIPDGNDETDDNDMEQCSACESDLPEGAQFCPNCGQAVPSAEAEETESESEESRMFTTEQVKALISPERAAVLDSSKTEYTAEELQVLMTPAVEPAPAPTEETEIQKARRLVAEDDARKAAEPVSESRLLEILAEDRKTTLAAIEEKIVEQARTKGGIQRRGSGRAEKLAELKSVTESDDIVTDARELASLDDNAFKQNFGRVFDPLMPQ